MSDHSLELLAAEVFEAASGDSDDGIGRLCSCGECVDTLLLVHDVNLRDRDTGGESHFLDDILEAAFMEVGGDAVEVSAAEVARNGVTPLSELAGLEEVGEENDAGCDDGATDERGEIGSQRCL